MAIETMSEFLDGLQASRLLEADRLDELLRRPEPPQGDVDAVSRFLETQGWLTRFQIDEIRHGRGRELQFAGYQILERMPDLPCGREFKAQRLAQPQVVVLRLVNADWLKPADDVAGYIGRARAVSQVSHPNQVNVIDADLAGDTPFIVHDFVDGASLSTLVNEMGPLPVDLACGYIRQAALALQGAHDRGIFHGDFSPAHMLLGPVIRKPAANGIAGAVSTQPAPGASIKVQETGLIPRRPPAAQISTQALSLPGAIDYQAPEQLTSAVPSAKSDLYSLGASLYFLLAGRPPFAVDSSVDCMLQLQETPVRIDSLRKDVRPALGDLIHQLLAKEPAARPRSAASLAQYLQPYIDFNDGPARIRVASTSAKSARLTEIGMEEVEAPTIEPFSHGTHDSRVFGLGRASGDGEQEHHDMFASNADDNHAGPSRLRKKKKGRPTRRRWGMIIFAIALHVVAFGFLAIYLLKAGPFAESKPTYKKHVPAKTNQ